jgi:hypothetical protein
MICDTINPDQLDKPFKKPIKYFNNTIKLKLSNPRKLLDDNEERVIVKVENRGITYYPEGIEKPKKGKLIIVLFINNENN